MASNKVKITILASEWGSSLGEPSTIIRELAIQLAKPSSSIEITFFVPQCSDEDEKEALRHNVHVLKATPLPGFEELEWLSFPPQHHQFDIIVGHGVKLGRQAQVIKKSHKCKWVQVVHTDPEELGMFKSYPTPIIKGDEKHSVEIELCETADFVVGIGPKLSEAFRTYLRWVEKDKTIFDLTPSVFDEFINVKQVPEERKHCSILVFGRGDADDYKSKGIDIAARAVAALPETHLVFVGAPKENLEEVVERFLLCGVPANRLSVRSYDKSRETLKGLFCEVDIFLVSSRTDGFGLSGLEALSAGLPVLVSKNSGFGEALSKVPFGSSFVIDSEDPERWAAAIQKLLEKDRQSRLHQAEALRDCYERKYSWFQQSGALLFEMMQLVQDRESQLKEVDTFLLRMRQLDPGGMILAGAIDYLVSRMKVVVHDRESQLKEIDTFLLRMRELDPGGMIPLEEIHDLVWRMNVVVLGGMIPLEEIHHLVSRMKVVVHGGMILPGEKDDLVSRMEKLSHDRESELKDIKAFLFRMRDLAHDRESQLKEIDTFLLRMRELDLGGMILPGEKDSPVSMMEMLAHGGMILPGEKDSLVSMMEMLAHGNTRTVVPGIKRMELQKAASAQQLPDDAGGNNSDDEKKDEEEVDDGKGDNVGEEVTQGGEQLPQQLHEVQTEEQQHLVEEEANKIIVYEGTVTSEGTHLDLKLGAVHLTFPPDAVSEPTSIVVHKWKSGACSPQLQEHEAIVSNVIEISTTTKEALQFKVGVKLFFSHCAPNLQGYELVIKRLINKETNDWGEVEGTVDARQLSDIEDEYPNEVPDFSFPVVQADIAECSIFTVICRLIPSPTFTISSRGGCFHHPDYPGVAVTVPKKAVSVKSKFPLQLKVQEVPNDEFKDGNVYVGPILRISCTQGIDFFKPVTIQLPVAPRVEGGTIPDPSVYRVRVLFLRSDGENKEWVEITDDLENPARFEGSSVTFQVKRFSGYVYIIEPNTGEVRAVDLNFFWRLYCFTRTSPIMASFFAYFRRSERLRSQDILHLVCCPVHLRNQVKEELDKDGVSEVYDTSSKKLMIPGQDKASVFVSGGISPVNEEYMGEVYLMLDASFQHRIQLPIRLISDQEYCRVEFRSFAELQFRLPSRQMQGETSPGFRVKAGGPTDEELQDIAGKIRGKWKALGRQLKIQEAQLTGFDRDEPDEYEKAYAMLKEWKQRGGSENATYQILKEALCHDLVGRKDLAEEFCCLKNSVSGQF